MCYLTEGEHGVETEADLHEPIPYVIPAGGDSGSLDPALVTILLAAGRKVESFPSDFATALLSGKVRTQM